MRSWKLVLAALAVAALAGAGIAYATIPSSGGVINACMLKNVGTVRLIDPSLPASNLLSHCSTLEAPISWNQQGQPGTPGQDGAPGQNGSSVVMGDAGANCANGGVSLTVGSDTRYVCNGTNGQDGQDGVFTGHFQSPNGRVTLDVDNNGFLVAAGPAGQLQLASSGLFVHSGSLLSLSGQSVDVHGNTALTASSAGDATLSAGNNVMLSAANEAKLAASQVRLNGCANPVARFGDLVIIDPATGDGHIRGGSPTVCAG
jgi:hypothetical protein